MAAGPSARLSDHVVSRAVLVPPTIRMATSVALQTVAIAVVGVGLIFSQRFIGDRPA